MQYSWVHLICWLICSGMMTRYRLKNICFYREIFLLHPMQGGSMEHTFSSRTAHTAPMSLQIEKRLMDAMIFQTSCYLPHPDRMSKVHKSTHSLAPPLPIYKCDFWSTQCMDRFIWIPQIHVQGHLPKDCKAIHLLQITREKCSVYRPGTRVFLVVTKSRMLLFGALRQCPGSKW